MNKLTASRANHLHAIAEEHQHKATRIMKELEKVVVGGTETARAQKRVVSALTRVSTATAGATRGFLAARQGVNPPVMEPAAAAAATAGPRRSAIGVTAGRSVLGGMGGAQSGGMSGSPSRSPSRSPSPSRGPASRGTTHTGAAGGMVSEKDPPLVVSAMLRGDTNVYEGVILNSKEVAAAVAGGEGAPAPRVDMSRVPLPPPPFTDLFLRVTARICSAVEFAQAFTPLHAAAFQKLPGSGAEAGGSKATSSTSSQDTAVVRAAAASVVAEVLTQDAEVSAAIAALVGDAGGRSEDAASQPSGALTVVLPAVANLGLVTAQSGASSSEKPAPLLTFDALRMTGGSVPAAKRLLDTVTHELTKVHRAAAVTSDTAGEAPVGLDAVVDFSTIGRPVYDTGVPPPSTLARCGGPSLYRLYRAGLKAAQQTTSASADPDLEALRDPDCRDFTGKVLASVLLSIARDMVTPLADTPRAAPPASPGAAAAAPAAVSRTVFDPAVLAASAPASAAAAVSSSAQEWSTGYEGGAGPGSALGARKSLGRLGGRGNKLVQMVAIGEEQGEEEDEGAWGAADDDEDLEDEGPPSGHRRTVSVSYQAAADGEW